MDQRLAGKDISHWVSGYQRLGNGMRDWLTASLAGSACGSCQNLIRKLAQHAHAREWLVLVASQVNVHPRYGLNRLLVGHGLPGPAELREWLRFLHLLEAWSVRGEALQAHAWRVGVEPSVLSRLVRRVTGESWSAARARGWDFWLGRFRQWLFARGPCRGVQEQEIDAREHRPH
jgi:hypothetical protein